MSREYWISKLSSKLAKSKKVGIYGIGKHTDILFKYLDNDVKDKIVGLIDKDVSNVGKKIYDYNVYSLDQIKDDIDTIIISSDVYQEVIYDRISFLKEEGINIIRIYGNSPTFYEATLPKKSNKYIVELLKKEEYEIWNKFVDESSQGCIFNKTWWLKAVQCQFEIYVCRNKNKEIMGGMVLVRNKNGEIVMPKLTQTLGILLKNINNCKYTTKISIEKDIIEMLVQSMSQNQKYSVNFSYNFTNWLPFMWDGYNQYCRYTYVIEDLSNLENIKSNFKQKIKYSINKAEKLGLDIKEDLSIKEFYQINEQTFNRKGLKIPYSYEFIEKFDQILRNKKAAKSFFAVDKMGKIYASVYIVFDKKSAYYLMSGINEENKESGAVTLLLWEAIKFSANVSEKFDFEGSCNKNIESFFRGFGGTQKMYFNIWKDNN